MDLLDLPLAPKTKFSVKKFRNNSFRLYRQRPGRNMNGAGRTK